MTRPIGTHEVYDRRLGLRRSSDRSFGFVMTAFLALVGVLPLRSGASVRWWALAIAAAFAVLASVQPASLRLLNDLWMSLAVLLNRIVQPVIMAVLFYAVFWPGGFVLRKMRALSLRRSYDPAAGTYWNPRVPPGPERQSMANQF